MQRIRYGVHTGDAYRYLHGVFGGRLRRVLQLRPHAPRRGGRPRPHGCAQDMNAVSTPDERVRHRIRVAGVVQGVGFRPFVHRLATDLDLAGHVGNDAKGVFVEVEGPSTMVAKLEVCILSDAPALARIYEAETRTIEPFGEHGFRISESRSDGTARTFVSPDIAVCDDCLSEMWDPADRRFRYPFINCTN